MGSRRKLLLYSINAPYSSSISLYTPIICSHLSSPICTSPTDRGHVNKRYLLISESLSLFGSYKTYSSPCVLQLSSFTGPHPLVDREMSRLQHSPPVLQHHVSRTQPCMDLPPLPDFLADHMLLSCSNLWQGRHLAACLGYHFHLFIVMHFHLRLDRSSMGPYF